MSYRAPVEWDHHPTSLSVHAVGIVHKFAVHTVGSIYKFAYLIYRHCWVSVYLSAPAYS